MLRRQQLQTVVQLYEAAKTPELWSSALQQVALAAGGIGAGYAIHNRRSGAIEWITLTGPCSALEPKYISFYAPHDLLAACVALAAPGHWVPMSHCVQGADTRRNVWYNDLILKTGIAEVLAAKVYEDDETRVLVGIQRGTASRKAAAQFNARARDLLAPIARAARHHVEFRRMGRALSAANQALQYLSAGVVLTDSDGRVLEMNTLASDILKQEDGLQVREGRLTALRQFESAKLAASISGNGHAEEPSGHGHVLIGRRGGGQPYAVTVAPLGAEGTRHKSGIVMVLIVNPDWHAPSERSVADFFGLSPAESRLASALMKGRKLNEIAHGSGVEICTLRTQLSSILRKVGVERQVDLVRILSSIGSTAPHSA